MDEFFRPVDMGTSVSIYIYQNGTTTQQSSYFDLGGTLAVTQPVTDDSTNTPLQYANGLMTWYQTEPDFTLNVTDGTSVRSWDLTGSLAKVMWPSFLVEISSSTYAAGNSIDFSTAGWVISGASAGTLLYTPDADNSAFNIGLSGTAKNSDFNVFVGTALGLKLDAGDPSLTWDGGAVLLNHNSNFNVGINTGTSTGNTTLGSSTSGTIALDTTAGITVNADDSYALTVSAGTIGAAATGGDITIDAVNKSLILRGSEAAADAVLIHADTALGGIDITSNADIDITTTGAAGEDISITNTGGSINIAATEADASAIVIQATAAGGDLNLDSVLGRIEIEAEENVANAVYIIADGGTTSSMKLHNDTGTSATDAAASIQITSDLGGIELTSALAAANQIRLNATGTVAGNAVVLETTAGGIQLLADGTTQGDITLDAEDDIILTTTGKLTITNTEPVTISGNLTPASMNIVDFVITDAASVTLTAAMSGKILLIGNLSQNTTIDLPAEADGMNFTFWYVGAAAESHDHIIDAEANANFYIGGLQFIDSDDDSITGVYSNGSTNSKLTLNNMEAGTIITITCDGTNWYITGIVYSDTAPAFAVSV